MAAGDARVGRHVMNSEIESEGDVRGASGPAGESECRKVRCLGSAPQSLVTGPAGA